jgi:PAS domain-containing protein
LNRCFLRRGRLIPVALIVATVGLLVATVLLFRAESRQRELLAISIRTSGWVAYQAQLEYVKAHSSLEIAIAQPSQHNLDDLALRLELLLSRIPILYESEEGRMLQGIDQYAADLREFEALIERYLDELAELDPSNPEVPTVIRAWHDSLEPLGTDLQKILQTSVAYNNDLYRREAELSRNPAVVPLLLMLVSGGGLILVLLLQGARDRHRLEEVNAAKAREAAMRDDFRAAIEAMPAVIVIFDPAAAAISFANPAALGLIGGSEASAERIRLLELML